jgi:hypothetical protein
MVLRPTRLNERVGAVSVIVLLSKGGLGQLRGIQFCAFAETFPE